MRGNYLHGGGAVLTWAAFGASWRALRREPGDAAQRAYCRTLGGIGIWATLRMPTTYQGIDRLTRVPNLARLLADSAGVFASWSFGPYMAHLTQMPQPGQQGVAQQGAVRASPADRAVVCGILATLGVTFALARRTGLDETAPEDFIERYGGNPAVLAYTLAHTGYLGSMIYRTLNLSRRSTHRLLHSPEVPPSWRRYGRLQILGWEIGTLHWMHEAARGLLRYHNIPYPARYASTVAGTLSLGSLLLLLSSQFGVLADAPSDYRAYRRLHPLWRDLCRPMPELVLSSLFRPRWSALADALAIDDVALRLVRRAGEIRDGIRELRPYADAAVSALAFARCQAAGLDVGTAEAVTAAATIADAIRARAAGQPAGQPLNAPILRQTQEPSVVITHLQAVSQAYRRSPIVRAVVEEREYVRQRNGA